MKPTFAMLFAVLTAIGLLCFFSYYCYALLPRKGTLEWIARAERPKRRLTFSAPLHKMERRDALPLLALTAVYAATAFFWLGNLSAPASFQSFEERKTVELTLEQEVTLSGAGWYTGLGTGRYALEVSANGRDWFALRQVKEVSGDGGMTWTPAQGGEGEAGMQQRTAYYWTLEDPSAVPGMTQTFEQTYVDLFKWYQVKDQNGGTVQARYLRLTGSPDTAPLELGELALYGAEGSLISAVLTEGQDSALFDEQKLIPDAPHWTNSFYFDEIYHARTADEFVRGLYPYEQSHPPLGKLLIAAGIELFGMTPFGWRFMGTLFGVAMVPLLYVFLKNLFGKTIVALCGSALFAFDFMHVTQTRLATIDTYTVFFVLAMYYFLYRFLALPPGAPFHKAALPLFLSGLMFGIGTACKWPVLYGGAGMAVLYFIGLYFRCRDWPKKADEGEEKMPPSRGAWVVKTLAFSVLCFVLIPGLIYTLSYWPYAMARGGASSLPAALVEIISWPFVQLPQVLRGERELFLGYSQNIVDIMLNNQHFMLTYHAGVHAAHAYSSRWYQWLFDIRPILYYMDNSVAGYTARFAAFHNPVVCWGGLAAILAAAVQTVRRRCGKGLFLVVGYLAQLLPWVFIGRTTFAYHYFPSALFLCMALAYVLNDLAESGRRWKPAAYALTGGAAGLYALFYPVLIGLQVPTWYGRYFLRWFPSWPF